MYLYIYKYILEDSININFVVFFVLCFYAVSFIYFLQQYFSRCFVFRHRCDVRGLGTWFFLMNIIFEPFSFVIFCLPPIRSRKNRIHTFYYAVFLCICAKNSLIDKGKKIEKVISYLSQNIKLSTSKIHVIYNDIYLHII